MGKWKLNFVISGATSQMFPKPCLYGRMFLKDIYEKLIIQMSCKLDFEKMYTILNHPRIKKSVAFNQLLKDWLVYAAPSENQTRF